MDDAYHSSNFDYHPCFTVTCVSCIKGNVKRIVKSSSKNTKLCIIYAELARKGDRQLGLYIDKCVLCQR